MIRRRRLRSLLLAHLFREGRVVSWHAYPDIGGMMAQLGVG